MQSPTLLPVLRLARWAGLYLAIAIMAVLNSPASGQGNRLLPVSDGRYIYVAPDGSTGADGYATDDALPSVEAGLQLLRPGRGDWLLLKRGSDYQLTQAVGSPASGTATKPTVIGAYGTGATPTLDVTAAAASFDPTALAASNVVARGVVLKGGGQGDNPVLIPGDGWDGPTPQPPAVGDPSQPGYDAKAIARWDVVPYQTFDGKFNVGVVAFHMNGIDRVEFSVEGGPWAAVTEMTLNPRTGVVEYWVTLDSKDFDDAEIHEVRAVIYPAVGEARVLSGLIEGSDHGVHSMFVLGAQSKFAQAYVASTGSDTSGDGTEANPYGSINHAINETYDTSVDYLDIRLGAGEYRLSDRISGVIRLGLRGWLTLQPNDGVSRDDVIVKSATTSDGLNAGRVRIKNMTVFPDTPFAAIGARSRDENSLWFDGSHMTASAIDDDAAFRSNAIENIYITDSLYSVCRDGPTNADLVRDVVVDGIGSDAFQNCQNIINSSASNIDSRGTTLHPDTLQFFGVGFENIIVFNITAVDFVRGQGFFAGRGIGLKDIAVVDCNFSTIGTDSTFRVLQLMGPTENLYILRSDFQGPSNWRVDQGFTAKNVLVESSTFSSPGTPTPADLEGVSYR